jgi:multidrug resistance efflux pump
MSNTDKLGEIQLRSDEVQEILTKVPSSMIRYGSASLLLMIVLVLAVSWFIKYPDIITTEATVTTTTLAQKEQAQTSAKIQQLLVKNNELVNAGDLIMILENTAAYGDVQRLYQTIDTLSLDAEPFVFPLDKLPVLYLGSLEQDYAAFENAYLNYNLNRKLKPYDNTRSAQNMSKEELQLQLQNLTFQRETNKKELEINSKELQRYKQLFEKGVVAAQEYELKQLANMQFKRIYDAYESQISQLRSQIKNTSSGIIGTNIENETAAYSLRKITNQSFINLKRAIADYERVFIIKATTKGAVSFSNNWQEGVFVNQTDLLFTIFPQNTTAYTALLNTPALNAGKIKAGQRVNIKPANYPDAEFGSLTGRVKSLSKTANKDGFYLAIVDLNKELITTYDKKIELKQEAIATADIVTEDLRLLERFTYKFRELFTR